MKLEMLQLLHDARIRTKLFALVLVPLLGLTYLAGSRALERRSEVQSASALGRVVNASVDIGSLLHELQKERGMSSGFISSKGTKFAVQLDEQRARTDKRLSDLRALVNNEGDALPETVRARLADAFSALGEILQVRSRVKRQEIDVKEVLSFYTEVNSRLLASLGAVVSITPDAELGRWAVGYLAFVTAKEKTGLERAQLVNVFTAGRFTEDQYVSVTSLLAACNTYLEVFLNTSPHEVQSLYAQRSNDPAFVQTAGFEKIAIERATRGNFGVDPTVWFDTITGKIEGLKQIEDTQAQLLLSHADASASSARRALYFALFLCLTLLGATIALAFYIIRDITVPLQEMTAAAMKIASGDVHQTIGYRAKNELGTMADSFRAVAQHHAELQANIMDLLTVVAAASDGDMLVRAKVTTGALGNVADAFNSLLESLQVLISGVAKQIDQTNSTVNLITNSSSEMASGVSSQAQELQAAKKMVEKTAEEIKRVGVAAESAAYAAKRAEESANEGATAIQNIISGMEQLRQNVQAGAKKMKNLGDRSMEITGIVDTISRISEQTNMLALNAAIEAARAGEHGRGFSVVAEEVRKLAERTAAATQEIAKLVSAIHHETNETVAAIEKQTHVVEQESALVSKAGQSLLKIREVSTESASLVNGISSLTKAQIEGTGVVGKTMAQISEIAQATLEGVNGTVTTLGQLTRLSTELTHSVRRFKVN
jgi:methyl-accepting chemotaxis protein